MKDDSPPIFQLRYEYRLAPPSTLKVAPVMKAAAGLSRKHTMLATYKNNHNKLGIHYTSILYILYTTEKVAAPLIY